MYFAKKLNKYLKDETYIVRKNAMDLVKKLETNAYLNDSHGLLMANQKFCSQFLKIPTTENS